MKIIFKNLLRLQSLILFVSAVSMVSCKKDTTAPASTVVYKSLGLTITNGAVSGSTTNQSLNLDVDNDNTDDFAVGVGTSWYGSSITDLVTIYSPAGSIDSIYSSTNNRAHRQLQVQIPGIYTEPLTSGTAVPLQSSASKYYSDFSIIGRKFNNSGTINLEGGFDNQGNQLFGFKHYAGGKWVYGWMRINLSADMRTLKIVDLAYNTLDNAPLNAGQKN